jgi:acetolactate synthase-1/2/3 large subunit
MRVADYIFESLYKKKVDTCFLVTGGGSMFLNDALQKNKKIKKIFCHNEQSCAMAADAYYRLSKKPAIVQVTTGPGSINALNGIFGAYVDSLAMIVICGQVKTSDMISANNSIKGLRQFGDQEVDIISVTKKITKKNYSIRKVSQVIKTIDDAYFTSTSGRPGPVLIEVPLDIQSQNITVKKINKKFFSFKNKVNFLQKKKIELIYKKIANAKRPIIIVGNGVRFSNSENLLNIFLMKTKIPCLTVWNSHDIVKNDNKNYAGRPGLDGERAGNFNLQNCDFLLILGARMHVRQIGFNFKSFAREAFKVMVDVDKFELKKKNLNLDMQLNINLHSFLKEYLKLIKIYKTNPNHLKYLELCRSNVSLFKVVGKKHYKYNKNFINPYAFLNELFKKIKSRSAIVTGDGSAAVMTFKIANLKGEQRIFTNKGCASMGYDLPAAIGAYFSSNFKNKFDDLICITGDGSIMMNLQELQTIHGYKIPIKIFVLNNGGYQSIRQTQKNYFENREIGCGKESGLSFPEFKKVSKCFGFKYFSIKNLKQNKKVINDVISYNKACICEVFVDKNQSFEPRIVSYRNSKGQLISPPLEEMMPRISKKLFEKSMIIKKWTH